MTRLCALVALMALAGCFGDQTTAVVYSDAGCITYGAARGRAPRPIPETELGRWVSQDLDAHMTGACR